MKILYWFFTSFIAMFLFAVVVGILIWIWFPQWANSPLFGKSFSTLLLFAIIGIIGDVLLAYRND